MTEKMQMLPLFQGLTLQDFNELIINMKLDFKQHQEGDTIVNQGDKCSSLIYVINGRFEAEYRDAETAFIIQETCNETPHLIEPYNMFGVRRTYERTYTFTDHGATFSISREFFMNKMLNAPIIRSNYINYLCNNLRKSKTARTHNLPNDIKTKIVTTIKSCCLLPQGEKRVKVKMSDLAEMIDETRLNVSGVLNDWNDEGLIDLRRFGFTIYDISKL